MSYYIIYRTNLPKEIMAFEGFPFQPHLPSFLHHSQVLAYLQEYCMHFNLSQFIQFQTLVEQVEPVPREKVELASGTAVDTVVWRVTTQSTETKQRASSLYDAVLVCNG